jgi:hypothetical protein
VECFVDAQKDFIILRKHTKKSLKEITVTLGCIKKDQLTGIIEITDGNKKGLKFLSLEGAVIMEFEVGLPFAFRIKDLKAMMGDLWSEA